MKKLGKILIVIIILTIIGGAVYYLFYHQKSKSDNSTSAEEKIIYPEAQTSKPNEEITKSWQNYSDPSEIFSLKYPNALQLNAGAESQAGKYLNITVEKISDLGTKAGIAEQAKEALEKGKLGPDIQSAIKNSQKMTSLDNGKVTSEQYLVATADNCQMVVYRELLFYYGENQIKITYLFVEPGDIVPDEFLKFDPTCQKNIWGDVVGFQQKISTGQLSAEIQTWYSDFDEIVKSIKIK